MIPSDTVYKNPREISIFTQISGEYPMTMYCEMCGEELSPEEEEDGICENCKLSRFEDSEDSDEEYIDPGIT